MTDMAVDPRTTAQTPQSLEPHVVNVMRRGRSGHHPWVYEVELDGRRMVWKDAGPANWIFRRIMGAVLLREARVLKRLEGMASVPALFGLVGDAGFLMEKLDAEPLPRRRDNFLSPAFFDALLSEVTDMHRRGVAHGDLRRLNILVERWTGRPKLIDFGTALMMKKHTGPLRRSLWRKSRRIDLMHVAKIKHYYFPDQLTEDEQRWLAYAPWHYRLGHFYRWYVYRPLKRYARFRRRRVSLRQK